MIKENDNDKIKKAEVGEDTTKYGEFVSSYFSWIPLPEQKKQAEELENMTNEDDSKNENNNKKNR